MNKLRIHHFFDILRDYGAGKELQPHPYGHSYHLIGKKVYENTLNEFEIVVACDDICLNCSKIENGLCIDEIDHRNNFTMKIKFNEFIDNRIMNTMNLEKGQIVTESEIIEKADLYLNNIFEIYSGNSIEHTEQRRLNVELGVKKKKSGLL